MPPPPPIAGFDLSDEIDALMPELENAIGRVLRSGSFVLGPEVEAFEHEAAEFLGVRHAVGLNSGTDALVIALRALDVGPGDEVVTTPFSFFATAESIAQLGATPVFVDIDTDTLNLDPTELEPAITSRTRAILPVHLFGRPVEMAAVRAVADAHGLPVIEDAAQAFGAVYSPRCTACPGCPDRVRSELAGRRVGALGRVAAFSFYPTKNLGAYGDAGMLATDDDEIAQRARSLRNHGSLERYRNTELGYNSRLDAFQAAILRVKLPHVDQWNDQRRRVAQRYDELLAGTRGIRLPALVDGHVFHQYTIQVGGGLRDAVRDGLRRRGIGTAVYYPLPQDRLPVFDGRFPRFPASEAAAERVLSLPMWPHLKVEEQERVVEVLKAVVAAVPAD